MLPKITLLRLGKMLRERRGDRGIREVARETGVSPATLSRVERGKLPDLATFSKICRWLKVDPAEVLQLKREGLSARRSGEQVGETVVAAHFRAHSTLDPEAAQDLAKLILAAQQAIAERTG